MTQDRVDAVVADLLDTTDGRGIKDLYKDLRQVWPGFDASFALLVACRKVRFRHEVIVHPTAPRWHRILNRLNDYCLAVEAA